MQTVQDRGEVRCAARPLPAPVPRPMATPTKQAANNQTPSVPGHLGFCAIMADSPHAIRIAYNGSPNGAWITNVVAESPAAKPDAGQSRLRDGTRPDFGRPCPTLRCCRWVPHPKQSLGRDCMPKLRICDIGREKNLVKRGLMRRRPLRPSNGCGFILHDCRQMRPSAIAFRPEVEGMAIQKQPACCRRRNVRGHEQLVIETAGGQRITLKDGAGCGADRRYERKFRSAWKTVR